MFVIVPYQSSASSDIQTEHYHSSIRNNKGKIYEEIPNFVVCHIVFNYFRLTNAVYKSAVAKMLEMWTQYVS
jgi:hypothetical protein